MGREPGNSGSRRRQFFEAAVAEVARLGQALGIGALARFTMV
jgi:hypothetical protein